MASTDIIGEGLGYGSKVKTQGGTEFSLLSLLLV